MSSLLSIASSVFLLATALGAPNVDAPLHQNPTPDAPQLVALADWQPEPGDKFYVDTAANLGYLKHQDGRYLEFELISGQLRWVYYIGRYYFAKTPDWDWVVKEVEYKRPSVTFGPTGRFLRLYKNGDTHTAYGIHGHRYAEKMLAERALNPADGFRSYGCILLNEELLNLVEATLQVNGGELHVKTVNGPPDLWA